jgi:filamentous hemagglutinin
MSAMPSMTCSGRRIVAQGGSKGQWSAELNVPEFHPNSVYVVNGYTYRTDSEGRVVSVEGTLRDSPAARNTYRQRQVGRSGRAGDQGGHLIASIFNGPGDRLNLVPMDGNLNMGRWRAMEREWAAAGAENVQVRVQVGYGESRRPEHFRVTYSINGGQPVDRFFMNSRRR